jgi:hypothetical protein
MAIKINGTTVIGDGRVATNIVFYENPKTIVENQVVTTNQNAMAAGPITVADSITVTVPDGSTWTIV